MTTIRLHENDLPDLSHYGDRVAIDTETMGLHPHRDRLCVIQLSPGDGTADVVRIAKGQTSAPNIQKLIADPNRLKLFHFGRFDIAKLLVTFGTLTEPVFCTKIASRLVRTYTDRHGLKDVTKELLNIEISKASQSSDWGADTLSQAQVEYAASDVLYLHQLHDKLSAMLAREGRKDVADACFNFLPVRAQLDIMGWDEEDIFAHS